MPGSEEALGKRGRRAEAGRQPVSSTFRRALSHLPAAGPTASVVELDPAIGAPASRSAPDLWEFGVEVRDAGTLEGVGIDPPAVSDGLGVLGARPGELPPERNDPSAVDYGECTPGIRSVRLLWEPRVRSPWIAEQQPARVRTLPELSAATVRSPIITGPCESPEVISVSVVTSPKIQGGESWIGPHALNARVADDTRRARAIPHTRTGVAPSDVSVSDTELYLRDAQELRGVEPGQAELVAVFRRVPIELITRLRLSENATGLSFEVGAAESRSRTRIHDLAAVRDNGKAHVHLVPHRSRFESVALG
jgi:hypothetical protein